MTLGDGAIIHNTIPIPGMTLKRATAIMYEAHSKGQAVVKRCHKELAELYQERLQGEGLTVSIEPAQ